MKQFIYLCAWALILGLQGVTPSIAGNSDMSGPFALNAAEVKAQGKSAEGAAAKFQNVEGTLKEIQGNVYVVEGEKAQQSIRVEVGRDTAFPNGKKEPGQLLQALISTSDGHALIIR